MKALEFKTRLKKNNNTIVIPRKIHRQISDQKNKDIRVIVLMEEQAGEEADFKRLAQDQFLEGYDKTDSIYDYV